MPATVTLLDRHARVRRLARRRDVEQQLRELLVGLLQQRDELAVGDLLDVREVLPALVEDVLGDRLVADRAVELDREALRRRLDLDRAQRVRLAEVEQQAGADRLAVGGDADVPDGLRALVDGVGGRPELGARALGGVVRRRRSPSRTSRPRPAAWRAAGAAVFAGGGGGVLAAGGGGFTAGGVTAGGVTAGGVHGGRRDGRRRDGRRRRPVGDQRRVVPAAGGVVPAGGASPGPVAPGVTTAAAARRPGRRRRSARRRPTTGRRRCARRRS